MKLNCKPVTKFQQNRSTSATATASLVRSLKSISVHYRHRRDWLSSVRPCKWQDASTSKVCVQNVHRVHEIERKLQDVDATAWPLYWLPPGGNVPTLRSGMTSAGRRHVAAVHTILQLLPNLVVDWVNVRTVGWPQSWSDEVWCFMSYQMHCLTCSVGWTSECLTDSILETEIFRRQYLDINNSCNK